MNVYVSKKHWASLLWRVLLITNECMWTKQGKLCFKQKPDLASVSSTKAFFPSWISPGALGSNPSLSIFPKAISVGIRQTACLEPERAAQFPHSSTTMLHNPTSSNQVFVSDTFMLIHETYNNWKNETLQHETCKLNLPCPPEPIGNPDISSEDMLHIVAWGCTWHGCWIEGNNHKYEGRNERENSVYISIHVSI